MTSLPVVQREGASYLLDRATGETVALADAPDRTIIEMYEELEELRRAVAVAKSTLVSGLRDRHGIGVSDVAGYRFRVQQMRTWGKGATEDALRSLVRDGVIKQADMDRCLPRVPTPSAKQLKALQDRLVFSDPAAAARLAAACTISEPALRELRPTAVDSDVPVPERQEAHR